MFFKKKKELKIDQTSPHILSNPVAGEAIELDKVNDEVFKSEMMGKGVAIIPQDNAIYSPIAGEVVMVFPTKHAYGIKSDEGIELLIHIGLDTVSLDGNGFTSKIVQGAKVKRGEQLAKVDFDFIKKQGLDPTVIMVVTNTKDYLNIKAMTGSLAAGADILVVDK